MMKDIGINAAEKRKSFLQRESILDSTPSYPANMKVFFDAETLEKMGIVNPPALGQQMKLEAYVEVTNVSKEDNDSDDDSQFGFSVQLKQVDLQGLTSEV